MKFIEYFKQKPRLYGIIIGAVIVFPPIYFFFYPGEMIMNTFFVIFLLIDWYFQKTKVYQSKLITGIVAIIAGYGLTSIIVMQTLFAISLLR